MNFTRRNNRFTIGASAAAFLLTCVGTTATVHAQDSTDDWEWEPGHGYHEQEWYDPSDWFDYETGGVDYEEIGYDDDDDDWDYDYGDDEYEDEYDDEADYPEDYNGGTDYSYDYNYYDDWYSAYYDGYFDGYYDDKYGYDQDFEVIGSDNTYSDAYADGYYDGYYDQMQDYGYDPYYYVITTSETNRDQQSDRQRRSDRDRERGDRRDQMHQQNRDANRSHRNKMHDRVGKEHRRSAKIRGTVDDVEYVQGTNQRDDSAMIVRVEMEDGKTAHLNLGPKMTKGNIPFDEGDRATFSGRLVEKDGRKVLMTHSITSEGETARIASRSGMHQKSWDRQRGDSSSDRTTMSGRVADLNRVRDIESDRYDVYRISLRDGNSRLVAISTRRGDDVDLESGDNVRVRGTMTRIDGRRVLVADRVRVNGENVRLSMN